MEGGKGRGKEGEGERRDRREILIWEKGVIGIGKGRKMGRKGKGREVLSDRGRGSKDRGGKKHGKEMDTD